MEKDIKEPNEPIKNSEEDYFENDEGVLQKVNRKCRVALILINFLFITCQYLVEIAFGTHIDIYGSSNMNYDIPRLIILVLTTFNYLILFPFLLSKRYKNYDIKPLIVIAYIILVTILYIWGLMFSLNF